MFEEQDQYVQDRSNAMEQVETTIVELGDMFVQLAGMVKGTYFFNEIDEIINFKIHIKKDLEAILRLKLHFFLNAETHK